MSQQRFFEYLADDATFDVLNARDLGIFDPGVYRGFDFVPTNNMNLTLSHDSTGFQRTLLDKSLSLKTGVIVSKQGVMIQEDGDIVIGLDATGGSKRTDLIVCEHEYVEIQGGQSAQYIVIKGPNGGAIPALTNPNVQVPIATISIPANTASLSNPNVVFSKYSIPSFSGNDNFIKRLGGSLLGDLDASNNKIINLKNATNDSDAINLGQVNTLINQRLPSGVIMLWSGAISDIPNGYTLCNGGNGTPNLRNRFVTGAGSTYAVGATGGAVFVALTVSQMPTHNHTAVSAGGHTHSGTTTSAGGHTHSGTTGTGGFHQHSYRDGFHSEVLFPGYTLPNGGGIEAQGKTIIGSGDSDVDNTYIYYKNRNTDATGFHTHTFSTNTSGAHTHTFSTSSNGAHTHTINNTGGSAAHENRPPYYALAYIMKT